MLLVPAVEYQTQGSHKRIFDTAFLGSFECKVFDVKGKSMKYIKAKYNTGYCGTDRTDYLIFTDDYTDEDIDNYIYELAAQHCESYGVEDTSDMSFGWSVIKPEEIERGETWINA